MRLKTASIGVSLVLVLGAEMTSAWAQERFTLDTLRRVVNVSSPEASPDGKSVAIVVTRPNYEENRNESELWAVDVPSAGARPLTFERRSVSEPRWSPNGRQLAFLAPDSSGRDQVWLLPTQGGEAQRVTDSPTSVGHYAWRPDGGAIAYAAEDPEEKREGEARHLKTFRVGDRDLFLRTQARPLHVWLKVLGEAEATRLTGGTWSLEFALPPGSPPSRLSWSPDSRKIAIARVPAPESGQLDLVTVAIVDVASGAITPLNDATRFQNNPSYSPDGLSIAYWFPHDGGSSWDQISEIYVAPAGGGPGRSLTRAIDRNIYAASWMPDGKSVLVAANDRTSVGLWQQPLDGPARRLDLGELVISGSYGYEVTVGKSGAIFFVATTPNRPPELYVAESPASKPRRLTDFNTWAPSLKWASMERIAWRSDGYDEDGVVVVPPDFSASRTYPLVLAIHGGPFNASKCNFNALAQLMAAEGWVVFMPNYRGSDNLGSAYLSAIGRDWGSGPGRDVMAGVAEVRKRPYIDKSRTAVTGWSYGGYMTTWLLGNYPNEWKVGMAGAPVTSFEDQYNLSDSNIQYRYAFGGSPWVGDFALRYREQSPITYARHIKAPTLIMSNMEDFRVPPTQALALYHALKDNGVETEFVGFEGRTHASADPVNGRERLRLWIEWVKRHMGNGSRN